MHAMAFSKTDNAELVAVSDILMDNAKRLGEKYNVAYYSDYNEMLKRRDIDAVSIRAQREI